MNEKQTALPTPPADKQTTWFDWAPLNSLRHEMDRLLEDFDWRLGRSPFRRPVFDMDTFRRHASGLPTAVDLVESGAAYEVSAELPGMDEKDVKVEVQNGMLRIAGEKREDKTEERKDYYLRERHFGAFERSFVLPEDVDAAHIEASFRKGVLTVKLPRKPEARAEARKIEVKTT